MKKRKSLQILCSKNIFAFSFRSPYLPFDIHLNLYNIKFMEIVGLFILTAVFVASFFHVQIMYFSF